MINPFKFISGFSFQSPSAATAVSKDKFMQAENLLELFDASARERGANVCFRYVENGHWVSRDWNEVRAAVTKIAGGLRKLGITKGDRVAILSKTRHEWTLADLGCIAAGAIVVPIYESCIEEQVAWILSDSGAKAVFAENDVQFKKVNAVQKKLPGLKFVISFVPLGRRKDGIYSLEELLMLGAEKGEAVYAENLKLLKSGDDATFVYTSGTTGNPKGAILTHGNFLSELKAGMETFAFEKDYESVIFLPLAHILARAVQYFQIAAGFKQAYAESIDRLTDNIAVIKPHFMASVPRIFEKIHARTLQGIETAPPLKKKIFNWAWGVGERRSKLMLEHKPVPWLLELQYKIAFKLVFVKLHEKLGHRIKFFISGGAPLSHDVALFFHVFGFSILEGYGLTETSAAITVNHMDDLTIGTVGKPVTGCEIRIAEDGEILTRGDMVFRGYYNAPEATLEAFTEDGWFKTGDIGVFDTAGHLKITDRKKDIIITAGGKNIAPQNIENIMKSDPYISQFMVHGDRRKFLSALVTLDRDQIERHAGENNIAAADYAALVKHADIHQFIKNRIDGLNKKLAKYESIKKFAILPSDFTIESGELTPTLKIKRKVINEHYREVLDGFYAE